MENNMGVNSSKTLGIVQVALMSAIICLVTMLIKVPTQIGYTHLGDSMIFVAAILFGKKKGALSAGIGMVLADLLGGYFVWAPFTLVIKGIMGFVVGAIAYRKEFKGNNIVNNILAFVVAGVWMVIAYYFANIAITRFIMVKTATLHQSVVIALAEIPGNCIEVVVGMVLALPLSKILKGKINC